MVGYQATAVTVDEKARNSIFGPGRETANPAFACFTAPDFGSNLDPRIHSSRDDKMNKYYPVIARAVERLDGSTGETRRTVYERAREAVAQLRSSQPALLDADIANEYLALEEAILKVEAEAACCLGSETGAEARSPTSAVSISYDDKVQSRDGGQSVSLNRDDRPQPLSSRQAPIFFSASNDRDNADIQTVAIGGAYGADHYHDEAPSSRWRGGFLVAMAALAFAVLAAHLLTAACSAAICLLRRSHQSSKPAPSPITSSRTIAPGGAIRAKRTQRA